MWICAFACLVGAASPSSAASLNRSVDVTGTPDAVWSMIGGFCAVKDWHPAIGSCMLDNRSPQTRTLVTKDGAATFVETQTAYSNTEHLYSYTFKSSPLPVSQYFSTLKVAPKSSGISTISWSSNYIPDKGKENDAAGALAGIYETGLDAIKVRLAK
jgi:hypothetical protein